MGRLDDAAKRKVVELRKAGLSFRKIKAVLELENIKVSAQAVYLFLREYQGKQGRIEPENGIISPATSQQVLAGAGGSREGRHVGWSNHQLQNLLREASRHAGVAGEVAKQGQDGGHSIEVRAPPPRAGDSSEGSSSEQHVLDKDIQIVSVTSLARNNQQRPVLSTAAGPGAGITIRKRMTPSQATNPMLAARRRLLDKAMLHRAKIKDTSQQSFQQVASLLRRDQLSAPETDFRRAIQRQPPSYDLTKELSSDGQPGSAGTPRHFPQQRPSLSVRSPQLPAHLGIRVPISTQSSPTSQSPGGPVIRLQTPGAQGPSRRDGNPSPQQTAQEAGGRAGARGGPVVLQEQIQTLATEVHSLGLAVRMLVQQQSKLEKEQVQQTQIQRQILSALQALSPRLGPSNSLPQQQNKTPTPPSLPAASTSFSQDTFAYSQGTYGAQCSLAQPSYNHMDPSLETAQTLKLPGLSPSGMNGFQPCSNTDSLPFAQTQSYAPVHPQQLSQTPLSSFTQSFAPTYTLSHPQTYGGTVSKPPDYSNSNRVGGVQECSRPALNSDLSTQDPQLNIIKVENI